MCSRLHHSHSPQTLTLHALLTSRPFRRNINCYTIFFESLHLVCVVEESHYSEEVNGEDGISDEYALVFSNRKFSDLQ